MDESTPLLRWFGLLLLIIAGTVGCAQSDAGDVASPTAPSSLPGPSASSSQSSVSTPMMGPPVIVYDATGSWHEVVTVRGVVIEEILDLQLTQDAGNITHSGEGEGELWTFTRQAAASGPIRIYTVTLVAGGTPCDADASGIARLNTRTNTIKGNIAGTAPTDDETSCTVFSASFTLTRN